MKSNARRRRDTSPSPHKREPPTLLYLAVQTAVHALAGPPCREAVPAPQEVLQDTNRHAVFGHLPGAHPGQSDVAKLRFGPYEVGVRAAVLAAGVRRHATLGSAAGLAEKKKKKKKKKKEKM